MTELTDITLAPTADPRCWALIPCAGTGSRAGAAGPKQYQMLAGKPMVMHTLEAFAEVARINQTLVVVSPDDTFFQTAQARNASFLIDACGGSTRAASVFNGLNALLAEGAVAHDWVLVHDAARCLVTPEAVNALMDACRDDPVGGLLALPLPDTLKTEKPGDVPRVDTTVSREGKWLAQTPQMFRLGALHQALAQVAGNGFAGITDEASAMERLGLSPRLVPGSAMNLKVTYPADFAFAEAVLKGRP